MYLFRVSVNLVTTFQCTQVLKGFGGRNRLYSIEGGIAGGNVEMLVGGIFGGSEGGVGKRSGRNSGNISEMNRADGENKDAMENKKWEEKKW